MSDTPSEPRPSTVDASFGDGRPPADLKRRSVRGGAVTLTAQGLRFALQMASTAILARLLTPADFGLLAMVTAITAFVAMSKDMGLSMATVQRAEIRREQVSTLFWANVTLSGAALVVTAALAPLIAWFYREPRLVAVTLALAGSFLLSGLGVQHRALLIRQMRFLALASVEVGAMAGGIAAAVIAALLGAGYWSLVIMHVTTSALGLVAVWIACPWRPGPPVRGSGVRPFLTFGGELTAFNVLIYLARYLDNVLIGRVLGAQALGLYSKAYNLLLLPVHQINGPVGSVALPALSRLQDDPARYRRFYTKGILLITAVGMPAIVFLLVAAERVVLTVLGDQWLEVVPLFRALGAAAFFDTFNVAAGWVYVSLGLTRRQLLWQLVGTPVIVTGILIGLQWGALGVAIAFSVTNCGLRLPGLVYCYRASPVTLGDLGRALWRPASASLLAGAVLLALELSVLDGLGPVAGLAVGLVAYGLAYLVLWCLLPGGVAALREILALARELRPSSPRAGEKAAGDLEEPVV